MCNWRRQRRNQPASAAGIIAAAAVLALALLADGAPARANEETPDEASIVGQLPWKDSVRQAARAKGVDYGAIYTSEFLANFHGGMKRGGVYAGKLDTFLKIDFGKLAGVDGLSFYGNVFQIHGTGGQQRNHVGSIVTISNIEALNHTRLSEAWLEYAMGKMTFRAGQLAADTEFFFSDYANYFINSDWPTIAASNLPSGGPAYPLSTPGLRLKFAPSPSMALLVALFNGDPAGPGPGEEQNRNPHGLNFRVKDPPLMMVEAQYRRNQEKTDTGLAGVYKIGAWRHFGKFDSPRWGTDGLALANPLSSGIARAMRGDWGVYGVIDQQLYRPNGGEADSGLTVFTRFSLSPSDRNLVNAYIDAGAILGGVNPARPGDKLGATFILAKISDVASGYDRDLAVYSGLRLPVRRYEMTVELNYMAQIMPGWTIQPVAQYVIRPSGGVSDPYAVSPTQRIRNAVIVGARSVIRY